MVVGRDKVLDQLQALAARHTAYEFTLDIDALMQTCAFLPRDEAAQEAPRRRGTQSMSSKAEGLSCQRRLSET
jgi:hypothetical protein